MSSQSIPRHVLEAVGVSRQYSTGGERPPVVALDTVSLAIDAGEFLAIMGPSGSGKSTLLHIMGCLDRPTEGRVIVNGKSTETLSDDELAKVRNKEIGFVFQSFRLIARASALENVELPLEYARVHPRERRERALEVLEKVGLSNRAHHRPNALSGGEQQRVAIARALVNQPSVILADEPTGALDSRTGSEICALFERLCGDGTAIMLITHDASVAQVAHSTLHMRDGHLL